MVQISCFPHDSVIENIPNMLHLLVYGRKTVASHSEVAPIYLKMIRIFQTHEKIRWTMKLSPVLAVLKVLDSRTLKIFFISYPLH